MTDYTLIHVAALVVFILVVIALTALTDYFLGRWEKPLLPPVKHRVTWCDTHGHVLVLAEENRVYICGICKLRIVRAHLDLTPLEAFDTELGRIIDEHPGLLGSAELGHQGQTGRAA